MTPNYISRGTIRTAATRLAGALLLAPALALLVPDARADAGAAVTEDMAQRIQGRLALVPTMDGESPNFTVQIIDDRYVVSGLVDGISSKNDMRSALEDIEGLDMDLLVDAVVVQ